MRKILFILSLLLMQTAFITVFAQNKPKAGDIISGIVSDREDPMMLVNVNERDSANRVVAHSITDIEGNFSFQLVNPQDSLRKKPSPLDTIDISKFKNLGILTIDEMLNEKK